MIKLLKAILVILILFLIVYVYKYKSFDIYKEFEGISYRLGEENKGIEPTSIILNGRVSNTLFGKYSFIGEVHIDNINYKLSYYSWKSSQVVNIDQNGNRIVKGEAYIDKNFEEITLRIFEKGHWSSEDGLMITCPSKAKDEALKITNRLMKDELNELGLKILK